MLSQFHFHVTIIKMSVYSPLYACSLNHAFMHMSTYGAPSLLDQHICVQYALQSVYILRMGTQILLPVCCAMFSHVRISNSDSYSEHTSTCSQWLDLGNLFAI